MRQKQDSRIAIAPHVRTSGDRGIIALVFRCKVTRGQPRPSDETEAFRWVTESEIRQLASEAYAIRVLDALHADSPAAIRQHDGNYLL